MPKHTTTPGGGRYEMDVFGRLAVEPSVPETTPPSPPSAKPAEPGVLHAPAPSTPAEPPAPTPEPVVPPVEPERPAADRTSGRRTKSAPTAE